MSLDCLRLRQIHGKSACSSHSKLARTMVTEQYERLVAYIVNGGYPDGLAKSEKFLLRQASESYLVKGERLYYEDKIADGQATLSRLVLQGREVERIQNVIYQLVVIEDEMILSK